MKFEVLTQGFNALPKIIQIFKDHSYKIVQSIQDPQDDINKTLHTFILSNDGNFQGLVEEISSICDVIDVSLIERNLQAESFEHSLRQKAQSLIDAYPNFVALLKTIDASQELDAKDRFKIGKFVGQGLVEQRKLKPAQTNHLSQVMQDLIFPAMRSFSLARVNGERLEILGNPLCLSKQSNEPSCYLLQGMIQGLLQTVMGMSTCTVCETSCKATGAAQCTFSVTSVPHP